MRRLVLLIIQIALACGVAHADEKPWAANVPANKQKDALALYQKGNAFFEQAQYKEALGEYQQALALWDHPAIRYNAAVCLINLDRPVEAYDNIIAALRFGDAPLGGEVYKQGLNYKKLLEGQLAVLEVVSEDQGASISLDGRPLFVAPGSDTRRVQAGDHQIVAEKRGYETHTQPIRLAPGAKRTITLKLKPLAAARRLERRWAMWKPVVVAIAGAAISGAGLGLYFDAKHKFDVYDATFTMLCDRGCDQATLEARAMSAGKTEEIQLKGRAESEANASYVVLGVGGAALATGMVLVLLNQKRLGEPVVAPSVGADRVGVMVSARW